MEPRDRNQLDELLDGALKHYGSVEPRAGLERRVLARLAAQASRAPVRWAWALVGACAVVLVVAIWVGIGHRRPNTPVVSVRLNVSERSARRTAVVTEPAELNKPAAKRTLPRRTSVHVTLAKAAEPRLQQFPSPRPVTQQELLVTQYVQRFPAEAMLIMKEQTKFDTEIQQAQREVENSSRISENQER